MLPGRFVTIVLCALLLGGSVLAADFDYEIASKAWCDHKCGEEEIPLSDHKTYCVNECLTEYAKVQRFTCEKVHAPADYCGVDCKDNQCDGIDICCNDSKCGLSCFTPDLSKYSDFPPVPNNVTVFDIVGRTAMIHWDAPKMNNTIYIIQERHYPGCHFNKYGMSGWVAIPRSLALEPPVSMAIKNGTWYEIRIAAVSDNGTRGFSHPSKPFTSATAPSPPQKPANLRFTPGGMKNKTVWGILTWEAPPSDLPIKRYTVLWSKRILGEHTPQDKAIVVMQRKTIEARRTFYKLRNLEIGVQYFLQVEAQAICGKKRLISSKAGKILNVTDISNNSISKPLPEKYLRDKNHLTIWTSKVINSTLGSLSSKISWNSRPNFKYVVTWRDIENSDGTLDNYIVVTGSSFELTDLQYMKTYSVKIAEKVKGKKGIRRTGKVIFVADPACRKVKRHEC